MQVRLEPAVERDIRLMSAASEPHVSIPKLVNHLLTRAIAKKKEPKRDAVPARRAMP